MSVDNRVLAVVVALALAGVAVGATGGPVADQSAQVNVTSSVQFDNQTSNGSAMTVTNATLTEGGFVAVYNESGALLGVSDYLDNGSFGDVEVSLDRQIETEGTSTLVAIAHRDTDANRVFTYVLTNGDQDGPYVVDGIVMDLAEVTVEAPAEAPETPAENVTETPGEETPGEETPTPVEETPGEETPTPVEETPGEETPGEETPGEETPGEETPGEETPGEEAPGEETPGEEAPGEETPGEEAPGEETPGEEAPGEETPGEEAPGEETPTPTPGA